MREWQIAILALLGLLSGCANWNSIHHTFKAGNENPDSISIDAKQRVIITTIKQTIKYDASGNKKVSDEIIRRACAEPSPDAISALASSLAGSGELTSEKLQAALKLQGAMSQTETSSFVGIRTQTIQLLRDGMFRLCEAYMSDALDSSSYNRLQRRYQNLMMGLLSIEQLTGAIVAPQIAIAGGAASAKQGASEIVRNQMAQSYAAAKVKTAKAKGAVTAAEEKIKEAKGKDNAVAKLAEAENELKEEKNKLTLSIAEEEVYQEGFEKSLSGANAIVSGGSAQVLQNVPYSRTENFSSLASSVENIVKTVMNKAMVADECFLTVRESMQLYMSQKLTANTQDYADIAQKTVDLMGSCQILSDNDAVVAQAKIAEANARVAEENASKAKAVNEAAQAKANEATELARAKASEAEAAKSNANAAKALIEANAVKAKADEAVASALKAATELKIAEAKAIEAQAMASAKAAEAKAMADARTTEARAVAKAQANAELEIGAARDEAKAAEAKAAAATSAPAAAK